MSALNSVIRWEQLKLRLAEVGLTAHADVNGVRVLDGRGAPVMKAARTLGAAEGAAEFFYFLGRNKIKADGGKVIAVPRAEWLDAPRTVEAENANVHPQPLRLELKTQAVNQ